MSPAEALLSTPKVLYGSEIALRGVVEWNVYE